MNFAQILFPDFSLIVCGYLVCRFTPLKRNVWEPVESLVFYFLFPVLLFHAIVRSPLDFAAASNFMAAGLALGLGGIALAYSLPYLPLLRRVLDPSEYAACAQVAFRFNSFIALALVERLTGAPGVLLLAVLIGACVPLFNFAAILPMVRYRQQQAAQAQRGLLRELLRNPFIIATIAGVIANLLGFKIPAWIEPGVARVGAAAIPLGLMAAGAALRMGAFMQLNALGVGVLTIRHLLLPLMGFALARAFQLNAIESTVLLTFSALPTAGASYVLATRMGFKGEQVAMLVTLSTLLSVGSLSFALGVLR